MKVKIKHAVSVQRVVPEYKGLLMLGIKTL